MNAKKLKILIVGIVVGALVVCSVAAAEEQGGGRGPMGRGERGGGHHMGYGGYGGGYGGEHGWGGEMMLERMQKRLGLTDEQVSKIKELTASDKEKMTAAREAVKAKHEALREAVEAGANEETVRAAAAELGKAFGDMAVIQASRTAEIKKILTEEQFKKWQEGKKELQERFGKMREERRGLMGPEERGCTRGGPRGMREGPRDMRGGRERPPMDAERIFNWKDSDGDGKLTVEEFTREGRGGGGRHATEEHFKQADTNDDGSLTVEELKTFLEQFKGRRSD